MCIIKRDQNHNIIYLKDDQYEFWKDYDSHGNILHYKNKFGFEYWQKFDHLNRLVEYRNSDGVWSKRNYVEDRLFYHDSDGLIYSIAF